QPTGTAGSSRSSHPTAEPSPHQRSTSCRYQQPCPSSSTSTGNSHHQSPRTAIAGSPHRYATTDESAPRSPLTHQKHPTPCHCCDSPTHTTRSYPHSPPTPTPHSTPPRRPQRPPSPARPPVPSADG